MPYRSSACSHNRLLVRFMTDTLPLLRHSRITNEKQTYQDAKYLTAFVGLETGCTTLEMFDAIARAS